MIHYLRLIVNAVIKWPEQWADRQLEIREAYRAWNQKLTLWINTCSIFSGQGDGLAQQQHREIRSMNDPQRIVSVGQVGADIIESTTCHNNTWDGG